MIPKETAHKLVREGGEEIPTQWVEVDKNSKLRTENVQVPPKMKSRLVARGDLEQTFGRTDSPTADNESVALV